VHCGSFCNVDLMYTKNKMALRGRWSLGPRINNEACPNSPFLNDVKTITDSFDDKQCFNGLLLLSDVFFSREIKYLFVTLLLTLILLFSVVLVADAPSHVGDQITLRLMKRERGTLLPIPVEEGESPRKHDIPFFVGEQVLTTVYSKLLIADTEHIQRVLKLERQQLEAGIKAAAAEPEVCFLEQALDLLAERERHMCGNNENVEERERLLSGSTGSQGDGEVDELVEIMGAAKVEDDGKGDDDESTEEDSDEPSFPNVTPEDVETESQIAGQKPFYFYQGMSLTLETFSCLLCL